MNFQVGQKVRIVDPVNFYNGRIGKVIELGRYNVNVATVAVPTGTGFGEVTFSLKAENAEVIDG